MEYLVKKLQRERIYKEAVYYPAKKRGESSVAYLEHIAKNYEREEWVDRIEVGMHIPKGNNKDLALALRKTKAGFEQVLSKDVKDG